MYKNLFIDLDDTLWAFSANAEETFREMFFKHGLNNFFDSFDHFYTLYKRRNAELWIAYGNGEISKEELNQQRFLYPLQAVGKDDKELAKAYSEEFFAVIPTKSQLMPHAREVLDYLSSRYRLFILSNGFRELQDQKMQSAGITHYFKRVILSEDIKIHKPHAELFNYALSATQSNLSETLMIGDSWEADIVGAQAIGMHQMYYNFGGRTKLPFKPTYLIHSLTEILDIL